MYKGSSQKFAEAQQTNKIRLGGGGGGGWNENRTAGFTVRVLLKLVVTLKPGLR